MKLEVNIQNNLGHIIKISIKWSKHGTETDTPPKLLAGLNCESRGEDNGRKSWGVLPSSQHLGGLRVCQNCGMGLGRLTSNKYSHGPTQTKQQIG